MDCQIFARCPRFVARLTLAIAMLASVAASARAQVLTATLTSPADGAINADPLQPFQWTSVASAQAYVLWVGTSVGTNNIVNTVELQQTSYPPVSLPASVTLYARMWTKVGGVWRSVDSTFSAAPLTATLSSPANGASGVNPFGQLQWTSVPNVQGYVLWVGTSVGTSNIVNTVELLQTSYEPAGVPSSTTLYARLWTKVGGTWRFVDSTFTTTTLTATLTAPANGATNVDPLQPFQWTTVQNAQAYVLWLGTSAGANNFLSTAELQQTSYQASAVPGNLTLYARLWTKVGGIWRFVDSTFTTTSLTATLTSPANGALNVSLSPLFQWTTVQNAQAYVLWVGTAVGTNNLINTVEMPQTQYQSPMTFGTSLTLYARMWTRVGGVWRSTDSTFSTPVTPATITAPVNGAVNVNPFVPITWTSVSGAEAYVLWVGTSAGTNNIVNTVELHQTSYQPSSLPANQTLHARVWTKVAGGWYQTNSTFTAASLVATLTYPANGAVNVDDTVPATWGAVPGAESYVLWVGSTQGTHNLLFPSESLQTSQSFLDLPPNRVLHARLWSKAGGVWRSSDSTFEIASVAPEFVYPLDGATAVNVSQPFQWTVARNAQAYRLLVGTTIGGSDLLDSGALAGTSHSASGLSASGPLYARVLAQVGGLWIRHTDILFTLDSAVTPAAIEVPFNGDAAFDSGKAFQWQPVALARGYRLTIGTTIGGTQLHDSDEIHVTRRFVRNLPLATLLYGRLYTKVNGQWSPTDFTDFTFTVASNAVTPSLEIKSALWATDAVRMMATDDDNRAYGWTQLFTTSYPKYTVVCLDFSVELLQMLQEMNLSAPSRLLNTAFNTNGFEAHTLVELWDEIGAKWMLLDPTFDLAPTTGDAWAAAADVSAATQAFDWAAVQYEFLGSAGDAYVRNYYLDYPLLYLNVGNLANGQGLSPIPYLAPATLPASGAPAAYLIKCTSSASADVVIDGVTTAVACNGIDSLSRVFGASTVAVPGGSTTPFTLYLLQRFAF